MKGELPVVIAISGKARSGKDQTAEFGKEYLESLGKNVLIAHYADFLKFALKEYKGWDGKKDEAGRSLLQKYGTEVFRGNHRMAWSEIMSAIIQGFGDEYDYVLIADCRFVDDLIWFDDIGLESHTVRVVRSGHDNGLTETQKNHRSETELDEYDFDYYIYNSGTLEDLRENTKNVINNILKIN